MATQIRKRNTLLEPCLGDDDAGKAKRRGVFAMMYEKCKNKAEANGRTATTKKKLVKHHPAFAIV